MHFLVIAREYEAHRNVNDKICRFLPVAQISTTGPSIDALVNLMATAGYCEITDAQNVFTTNFREDPKKLQLGRTSAATWSVLPKYRPVCCELIRLSLSPGVRNRNYKGDLAHEDRITPEHHYFISWVFVGLFRVWSVKRVRVGEIYCAP